MLELSESKCLNQKLCRWAFMSYQDPLYHKPILNRSQYVSVSSKEFQWLFSEHWENDHFQYFFQNRKADSTNLWKSSSDSFYMKKTQKKIVLSGSWVLIDLNLKQCVGWAETTSLKGHFQTHFLSTEMTDCPPSLKNQALAFLLSSLFITTSTDVIDLTSFEDSQTLGLGTQGQKIIYTLTAPEALLLPKAQTLAAKTVYSLSQNEWSLHPAGIDSLKHLHYLEIHKNRTEKHKCPECKKKPLWRKIFHRGRICC